MKIEFTIPSKLSEIQLGDYQKFMAIVENNKENDEFIALKMIEIFCGVRLPDINAMPLNEFEEVVSIITNALNEEYKFKNRFKLNGIEFGFIPNLDDLTTGEYIDINEYLGSLENFHKAMAVLYRPITIDTKGLYAIEDYEGSDKYSAMMKAAPLDIALASQLFFWTLGIELMSSTAQYLEAEVKNNPTLQNLISDVNGDGTIQFTQSLKETLQSLTMPLSTISTKFSLGLLTRKNSMN